jgi:hypothetical protein
MSRLGAGHIQQGSLEFGQKPKYVRQNQNVRKQPIQLGSLKIDVHDVHRSHLPWHHHSRGVKFLGNV